MEPDKLPPIINKDKTNQNAKVPGKLPLVAKFLKDVGHFLFSESKGSAEVARDLKIIEQHRAGEQALERATKERLMTLKQQAKLKAQAEAKQKQELLAKAKLAKKMAAKAKLAEQFRHERERLAQKRQAAAEHVLKEQTAAKKQNGFVAPPPPRLPKEPKKSWFSFGAKKSNASKANEIKPPLPPQAPAQTAEPVKPADHKERIAKKFQDERLKHETVNERQTVENRSWQSYNVVSANLIRDQRSMFLNWQGKILLLVLFSALAVLLSVLAYGFLLILEKDKVVANQDLYTNLASMNKQISQAESETKEITDFNNRLLAVDYLLKNHLYWSNFFKFLEDNTIWDVYYLNFGGDTSGSYTIPSAAKDYRAISMQLAVLQAATDYVLNAQAPGAEAAKDKKAIAGQPIVPATTTPSRINFDLNLQLNPSLFIKE